MFFRRKKKYPAQLTTEQVDDFRRVFAKLMKTLALAGHHGQSSIINELDTLLYQNNYDRFWKLLYSVDMWGGPGAVWEVGIYNSKDLQRNFLIEMIELVDLMKLSHVVNRRIKHIRKLFNQDLKKIR